MAGYRAFLAENSENYQYELIYYHNPNRWRDNITQLYTLLYQRFCIITGLPCHKKHIHQMRFN